MIEISVWLLVVLCVCALPVFIIVLYVSLTLILDGMKALMLPFRRKRGNEDGNFK